MSFFQKYKSVIFKRKFVFFFMLWLFVQIMLIWQNGIITGLEATKYINEANYFLKFHRFNSNNHYLYSTQIFLIILVIKFHLGYFVIVIFQIFLNFISTVMFYKLSKSFLKIPPLVSLAIFFFIVNIPYQQYNTFLFTESIFYSLTIIYSSYLFMLEKLTLPKLVLIILLGAILCITRPTGILFLIAAFLYIFFRFLNGLSFFSKSLIVLSFLTVSVLSLNVMLNTGGSLDFMLPFKKENIICGVNNIDDARIQKAERGNSLQGIAYYIINNKEQFFKLSLLKTTAFFGMLRNYYSFSHNVFLVCFFYPFYICFFIGIRKIFKQKDTRIIYIFSIIILYWITTLLTCDDWHNRFVLTVSPFLFLIGLQVFAHYSIHDEV